MERQSLIECDLSFSDDLADWGLDEIAYIKKDVVDDSPVWSIYAAEGTRMGYAANRDVALAIASQNDLIPMSVH